MGRIRPQRIAVAIAISFAVSIAVFAQNSIATIDYLEGQVDVTRANQSFAADFGTELELNDVVRSGAGGLAIVTLSDGSQVKLRANTTVAIETLAGGSAVELRSGGIFARVNRAIGGNRAFEVRTPTVVAGVRGTEFFVAYGRTIEDAPDLWLCVNEGSVQVDVLTTDQTTIVNEGEGINILGGDRATDPRFYSWTTDLNWNFNADSGEVRDETDLDAAYGDLLDQDYD